MYRLKISIDRAVERVCILFFVILLITLSLQIFCRYVLNHPLSWTEELARYIFIWVVFLGACIVLKNGTHVSITSFISHLPLKVQAWLAIIVDIFILFFLFTAIFEGIKLSIIAYSIPSAALELPWTYIYLAVPVSGSIMIIHILHLLGQRIRQLLSR